MKWFEVNARESEVHADTTSGCFRLKGQDDQRSVYAYQGKAINPDGTRT
jgi:hypothetical protein